ncbi:MAG TPA: efflux RND transporter permease subunit [Chloroflexota bacterium]|nr:efflux RND transporter permease subunit [Chloroflexota bacterium]
MTLTRLALTRPVAILMLIGALLVLGIQGYVRLAVDRLPPTNFPAVTIVVSYSGASPRDVEQLIAIPLEKAVAGLRGVETISSTSSLGSARVNISFSEATNLDQAAIDVAKRVEAVRGQLPPDAGTPSVVKAEQNAFPIMNAVMSGSGGMTTGQLYQLATEVVQPALLAVDGVADVSVSGGRQREVQVRVDPLRLKAFDISMQQIVTALSGENVNAPSGTIRVGDQEPSVRFSALAQSIEELKNIVVSRPGGTGSTATGASGAAPAAIYVRDVAEVVDTYAEATRFQRFNGQDAIGLSITKQPDANSIKVADEVKQTLDRVQRTLPPGVTFKVANDTTHYTREALNDVQFDLGLAVFITGTVLLLFLHSWRNTVIVLLAIPTSLISTFLVMFLLGFSLNLMSLMALALLIGILVDDSIVVLENIHRHLQAGEEPHEAALKGRNEIGLAAMAITLLDVVVFVPIGFMQGNLGSLFRQFGLTVAVATLFSLFVSFTLTPMLASRWLKRHGDGDGAPGEAGGDVTPHVVGALLATAAGLLIGQRVFEQPLQGHTVTVPTWVTAVPATLQSVFTGTAAGSSAGNPQTLPLSGLAAIGLGLALAPLGWWLLAGPVGLLMLRFPTWWETGYGYVARSYGRVLSRSLRLRPLVIVLGVGTLAATLAMVHFNVIGSEYAPREDENQLSVNLRMPPGVSVDVTDRMAQQVEAALSDKTRFPEVKTLFTSVSSQSANIAVELVDKEERQRSVWQIQAAVRQLGETLPDVTLTTNLPSALGGGGNNVSVRVVGPDPAVLSQLADQFEGLLRRTPGVVEVSNSSQAGQPEILATVNREALTDLAVSSSTISQTMRTAIQGSVATQLRTPNQDQMNVRVLARRASNGMPVNLEEIPVLSSRGVLVRLGQVAKVESATGPSQINRSDRNRSVGVSGAVAGRPVGDVARDLRAAMREVQVPNGYRAIVGGGGQQLDRAVTALIAALSLSILLMYMLLAALYESFLYPLIVLLALPLAMVGALGGLWVTGHTLNIFSLIGVIMLTGVVSKNAILLVDYTNTLRKAGRTTRQALLEAGPVRLRPILMTSATMICSMMPLALGAGPGGESRAPMAVVIIGGMLTSTLLTLLFVPALYTYFDDLQGLPGHLREWRARRRQSEPSTGAGMPVPATAQAVLADGTSGVARMADAGTMGGD